MGSGLQTWGEISGLPSLSALLGVSKGDAVIRAVTGPPSRLQYILHRLPCHALEVPSSSSTKRAGAASSGPSKEEEAG